VVKAFAFDWKLIPVFKLQNSGQRCGVLDLKKLMRVVIFVNDYEEYARLLKLKLDQFLKKYLK